MTIARREVLAGSAAVGLAGWAGPSSAAPPAGWAEARAGALPMPPPRDSLPPRLPVTDPGRTLIDRGWLFHDGDIVPEPPRTHHLTYASVKAGVAPGAAAMDYDDSDWRPVTLPHDWASHQPFVATANPSQGYRPRGIGRYRRTFKLPDADRGKRIELQLGAVASNATVWVNGSVVAHSWSGYSSILIDLTPFARFGDDLNVVAVRADASVMEGWWYEGAGLYRHAWLAVRAPVSIATDGVHCDPRRTSDGRWQVPVTVDALSVERTDVAVTVAAVLEDPDGRIVAQGRSVPVVVPDLGHATLSVSLDVADPLLWSIERPLLYTLRTVLERDGQPVDRRITPIGFRTIRFDADRGFFLNETPVKLKGVCLHQDHAGVGVAVPDALLEWRLSRLKDMGVNAIRCSHNAPAEELLDFADRMGFVVMDENRLFNPAPDYLAQLAWLVRRDRNHPSVILWSVFNEEPMQGTEAGVEMVRRMVHAVRELDDSRPVTAAMNGAFFDPVNVMQVVDVGGFNYYQGDYDRFHRLNPTKPITSSEDTSAYQTRGAFASDPARHVITSYDTEATSWGDTHRGAWKAIVERPFVAGGFVWTGFDYHGEPTPYEWPVIASYFGAMDLCGFPKTAYDIHRAHWIDAEPVVAMFPHWTWPGREGEAIKLVVMSNADRVELRVNGRSVGDAAVDRIMGNSWDVPYAPGRIEAIAYRGSRVVARAVHETTGAPVALRLTPARRVMAGDGEDAQPVTIDAVDAAGRHVPIANLMTEFTVDGATIIGVGNGDNTSHEPEKGNRRSLFNGLAQVIVQADIGRGAVRIRATATGLRAATLTIDRLAAAPRAQTPAVAAQLRIDGWRRSPLLAARPAADLAPAENDNNSWAFVRAGVATPADATAGWRVYRANVALRRRMAERGGDIAFASIGGRAEVWIDGAKVAAKADRGPGGLVATIPPGATKRTIALIVEASAGLASGLLGPVVVTAR